jgi:hypothetical protein
MSLFSYDYDDLAAQIQHGLERIAVNFLRAHGAQVVRDAVDFHDIEQIDLELESAGHSLKVHQVGRPRGPGYEARPTPGLVEEFESLFDGWPAQNSGLDTIAGWLASLPAGEAPARRAEDHPAASNPFAVDRPKAPRPDQASPAHNPFMTERSAGSAPNPFADSDAERRRQETLRRLRGDD